MCRAIYILHKSTVNILCKQVSDHKFHSHLLSLY
nr:MAG TPA: hypothetical protein [Caudoviricetes sp.]